MPLLTFGINHNSAPLTLREQLTFQTEHTPQALQALIKKPAVNEAVLVSTCNRTEIYTSIDDPTVLIDWLKHERKITDLKLDDFCYAHQELDAVKHLMRVATGLDSMVLGEPQIFGQIKQAYQIACDVGAVGKELKQLFPAVFSASKLIRNQTNIGKNPISLAFATVSLAKEIFAKLDKCKVLLVGAGEIMEVVGAHLRNNNVKHIIAASRTVERAEQLTQELGGQAIRIGDIPAYLKDVDIIITATASQLPIIGKGMIETAIKSHKHRPLFIADLAMPRDVEPEVCELDDVYLYNLDDLNKVIQLGLRNRQSAAAQAETLIEIQAQHYIRQLRINDASDIIRQYREQLHELRDQELMKSIEKLNHGHNPYEVLSAFAHGLTNKVLHKPTVQLRKAAYDKRMDLLLLAKHLFEI